jgi:hypothetical protein
MTDRSWLVTLLLCVCISQAIQVNVHAGEIRLSPKRVEIWSKAFDSVPISYTILNMTTKDLHVDQVATSCGCTVIKNVVGEQVHAGQSLRIDGTFSPVTRSGTHEKSLAVKVSSEDGAMTLSSEITFHIDKIIDFDPEVSDLDKDYVVRKAPDYQVDRVAFESTGSISAELVSSSSDRWIFRFHSGDATSGKYNVTLKAFSLKNQSQSYPVTIHVSTNDAE